MNGHANPVAGWYPDPGDPASRLRFWDGATWTDLTAPTVEPEQTAWGQPGSWPGPGWGPSPEPEPASWTTPNGAAPFGEPPAGAVAYAPSAAVESGVGGGVGGSPSGAGATVGAVGAALEVAPGALAWQSGAGPFFLPAPTASRKKSHIGLIVGGAIVVVALVIGGLVALGLPVYNKITGHTWFNGGVPGWSPIRVSNFPSSGATLLQAWRVPGPTVGPSKPFLQVAKLKVGPTAGETATQYLTGTLQYLTTHGPGSGELVTINDGAPALEWSRPTPLANDPTLGITSFWLYAEKGSNVYWMAFQTDSQHYASELPGVEAVMLNFKATGH
jgi:hypothetical protein